MPLLTEPNQVGKREDLSDLISVVDAKETPLSSMIPKGQKPANSIFDWQVDAYDKPSQSGVVDGSDVTTFKNKAANRVKLSGRVQWVREPWMVSKLAQDLSNVAGVDSEKARAVAKCLTELKRSIEAVIGSDGESQEDNGNDKAYLTRGLGSWISNSAQSDLPVPAAFRTPSASINTTASASLTETHVQDVLESSFQQSGRRSGFKLVCGTKMKRVFTGFGQYVGDKASNLAVRRMNQSDPSMIQANVGVFEGDFGTIELIPDLWLAYSGGDATSGTNYRGYLLDMDMLELRFLERPGNVELEDKGGGPRGYADTIFGLVVKNPLGLGKFAATS